MFSFIKGREPSAAHFTWILKKMEGWWVGAIEGGGEQSRLEGWERWNHM
jgi:hypothetical protein